MKHVPVKELKYVRVSLEMNHFKQITNFQRRFRYNIMNPLYSNYLSKSEMFNLTNDTFLSANQIINLYQTFHGNLLNDATEISSSRKTYTEIPLMKLNLRKSC